MKDYEREHSKAVDAMTEVLSLCEGLDNNLEAVKEELDQANTNYENERGYAMALVGEKEALQKQLDEANTKIRDLEVQIEMLEDRV